ncbi:hypothetical protein V498_09825 [Pseudogymnoascus sp. VKM F-4517 (FW-2822)]|nr:hypothetical protein V498_09825 [Pseudogymnoascus sp. VKM F-4517 (FW-2822)]
MYKQAIPEQSHPEQSPAHNKRVGDDHAHDHDHKEGHDVTKVYESYEGYGSLQSHKSPIRQVLVNIRRLRQITVQDTPKLGGSQVSKVKPAKSDEEFPLVCHKCQGSAENLVEAACTVSTVLSYLTDAPLLRPYNPYSGITTLSPPVANFLLPPTNHRLPTTTATV